MNLRNPDQPGRARRAAEATAIVCLATVSGIYHLSYDGLLLWAPIAIVLLAPEGTRPIVSKSRRWLVGGLLLAPMFYVLGATSVQLWARSVLPIETIPTSVAEFGWALICTFNGLTLLLALVLLVGHALRMEIPAKRAEQNHSGRDGLAGT